VHCGLKTEQGEKPGNGEFKGMSLQFIQNIYRKRKRYTRHAVSLVRYSSGSKVGNLARVEWERFRKKENVTGLPYVVVLDPTNVCNLKCPVCPTPKGDLLHPSGRVSPEDFEMFIDRIAAHTYRLILYNWGEPFLHKQIIRMLSYAHRNRISTAISSNLNILPREGAEALVMSGLDDLVVSCDGLSQETYERYRVGGELEKVVANLNAIKQAKKKLGRSNPSIEFQFLVFRHNEHEADRVHDFATQHGADTVRLVKPAIDLSLPDIQPAVNPDYTRPEYQVLQVPEPAAVRNEDIADAMWKGRQEAPSAPDSAGGPVESEPLAPIDCYWPWRVLTVNWNGEVDPCCYNNQLGSFGNIFGQPLIELINNDKYVYARRRIVGRASPEGFDDVICKRCKGYTV
jgi:MoaA/NifB/PqqE/SkfB family radical SAM enzyme